jgi:hypothetical protein
VIVGGYFEVKDSSGRRGSQASHFSTERLAKVVWRIELRREMRDETANIDKWELQL